MVKKLKKTKEKQGKLKSAGGGLELCPTHSPALGKGAVFYFAQTAVKRR